jgi:tRNA-specific 2-thiouridylase
VRGAHEPHYVLSTNPKNNEIVVGKQDELKKNIVFLNDVINHSSKDEFLCQIKLRYRQQKNSCRIVVQGESATVYLEEPAYGIASGQVGVLYENNKVIGSGFISDSTFSYE